MGIPNVEGVILSNAEDPNYNTATITNRGAEGTNAGIYKVKASLKIGHCWEDYSTNDRFYEFRIEGRKFDIKPIRLVYNSTFQVAYKANLFCKFENVPCEIGYLAPLITQRGVEGLSVGKYKVRAVPNPAFTWEDGTRDDKILKFEIAKAHPRFNCPKDPIKLNVYDCYCADIETGFKLAILKVYD